MNVLGLIPARGGSKGLQRKNILELGGKPLIAWTIEVALGSTLLNKVVVSTDDEEIAAISAQWGAEVPFTRPPEFSADNSPTIDAIQHALTFFEKQNETFDVVALLEPTSPLRKRKDIDNGLQLLLDNYESADGVISVGEVHLENPYVCKTIKNQYLGSLIDQKIQITKRQDYPKTYFPYGVLYASKTEILMRGKTFYSDNVLPYFIERWQNYEIDDLYDFICVESILKHMEMK
jgi:CMP-N,N'-diacetyllegionaminic acid synthase